MLISCSSNSIILGVKAISGSENEFALEGKKQTTSRIGVLTGLNRKEVVCLLKPPISDTDAMSAPLNRAQRVLSAWLRDKDFLDEKGDPRMLSFSGPDSFSELVKRYSGDMPARAVADELIRVGVLHEDGGALRLLARSYVPHAQSDELSNILGTHVSDLIDAIDHNMTHDRERGVDCRLLRDPGGHTQRDQC